MNKVIPADDAIGVAPAANISAFFTEGMKASTVNTGTVKLRKAGTTANLSATVTYDTATKKATLNPNANLKAGATYVATVTSGAKDLASNRLDQNPNTAGDQPKSWRFEVK